MTPLEARITALLVDMEALLRPIPVHRPKWMILDESRQEVRQVRDDREALGNAVHNTLPFVRQRRSYVDARAAFDGDRVFAKAMHKAGYWGTFDAVLTDVVTSSGAIRARRAAIDPVVAVERLKTLRRAFSERHAEYTASARLVGVDLGRKTIQLAGGVTLNRLTRKERNERQPYADRYFDRFSDELALSYSKTEVRTSITVPVDQAKENALLQCHNDAQRIARETFSLFVRALLLAKPGHAQLGPIHMAGVLDKLPTPMSLAGALRPGATIKLGASDVPRLEISSTLVAGGRQGDRVLSRALHRFLLGRQRTDLVDRLVDYVISWEAVLLTQGGTPVQQEMSYRFGANGASLLRSCSGAAPRETHRKLRAAYDTRSRVVHGGEDTDRDAALAKGGFANLHEVCDYLESAFRQSVFWLASLSRKDRPYFKDGGWESLLWQ